MNGTNTITNSQLHQDKTDAREADKAKGEERVPFQTYVKERWGYTLRRGQENDLPVKNGACNIPEYACIMDK